MASRRFQKYGNHSDTDDESVEEDEQSSEVEESEEEDEKSIEEEESESDENEESGQEEDSSEDGESAEEEESAEEDDEKSSSSSSEEESEGEYECGEDGRSSQEEDSSEDGESVEEEESAEEDDEKSSSSEEEESSEEEDSDDEHSSLYHYTSERGYTGMKKNKKILPSSVNAGDAVLGKGVYLTHLPPTESDAKIISNNWDRGLEISNYFIKKYMDKIDICIEFNSKDLPGVIEYSGDRDVVLYPGTINLSTVPYKVHHRE